VSLTAIPAISWWSIAYLVVWFCTYFLLPLFMHHLPPKLVVFMRILIPIIAVLLGAAIFGETNAAIVVALLYLDCTWLIIRCERTH
jgi:drug/metabolite transporter (DMT)-like permease